MTEQPVPPASGLGPAEPRSAEPKAGEAKAADAKAAEAKAAREAKPRPMTSIVPRATIAGRSLVAVVAIMTFLAGLTIGSVFAVSSMARQWRADVAREVTIQVRAGDPKATDAQVAAAAEIARQTPGVSGVHILSPAETGRLLEPWLGTGLDLADLPVPRVVVLRLDGTTTADLARLRRTLSDRIPTATLDDHRGFSRRLGAMADGVMFSGLALLALVGVATVLSVVFATRAAVATNRTVVEVLHFVGAQDGFIAAQFQRHFLKIGAQGGLIGGLAAAAVFGAVAVLPMLGLTSDPEAPSVLGWLDPGPFGYAAIAGVVVAVAMATAFTSRLTVYRTLRTIQ